MPIDMFLSTFPKIDLGIYFLPDRFSFINGTEINRDGNEKIVYQVTDEQGQKYAVKILIRINESSDERIRIEFEAARYLKTTSLKYFVPEPI